MLGTVWPSLFQTPQSAEHLGMAMLCSVVEEATNPHSDCAGAVNLHNASRRDHLGPKQMFAGLRRLALESDPEGLVGRAAYTPAHRSEE
eukprot:504505-Pyramimonas_sp.AAC.1